ncbi:hypothetical protein OAG69_00675 [bacterium]|nr:hypothetical protein [Akkermansiaceae bacterium]MDB4666689.1 hypothetical protein [bacterium]MDB4792429.1 hypothetical protein [bacterium]
MKSAISISSLFVGTRILCVAIFAPGLASGAAIPVNNASFEDNVLGGNAWADAIPNGWFSEGNVAGTPGAPTTDPNFNNTFLELSSAIGASGGDGPNNLGIRTGGLIYQDLGVLFQPNTTYTVDIMANRRGAANNVGYFGLADITGATMGTAGAFNSSEVTTSNQFFAVSSLDPAAGNVATFTTGANVPAGNVILAVGATTGNVVFDLVSVDATSNIPDPDGDDDNDGLLNAWEVGYGLDPNSDAGDDGADGDQDGDNLTNLEEQTAGTNPTLDDSDNDGLKDGVETGGGTWTSLADTGTDPLNPDGDGDGLLDGVENNSGIYVDENQTGSNPNELDTDGDSLPDGWEVTNGIDPNDAGVDVKNGDAGDPDADTSSNLEEFTRGTDPNDNDSDDDTVLDGYEDLGGVWVSATQTGTDPLDTDSDNDGISDGAETGDGNFVDANQTGSDPNKFDTDADGYPDEKELSLGTNPNDPNDPLAFPVPLGYWSFDDQGAVTTADLSPNGYDGTVLGEASYVAGHTGAAGDFAIDLDGIDDAVTTQLTLSNIAFFTMAGWIKSDVAQTDRTGLFGQNDILEFGFSSGDTVQLWSNPGGSIGTNSTPTEWTHVALVSDGTGRMIFIDGVEVARGAAAIPLNASDFFFNIGGGGIWDATGNFFQGQIDDVAVWDISMSPQLIADLANGTISPIPSDRGGLRISSIVVSDNDRVTLTVDGTIQGVNYAVDGSTDLENWLEVDDFSGAAGGSTTEVTFPLSAPISPKTFFLVKILD